MIPVRLLALGLVAVILLGLVAREEFIKRLTLK